MRIGGIEVTPLAAESMGVRSMCTQIRTPDVRIVLDPSAALSMRYGLEPHPREYRQLLSSLERIFAAARSVDLLSVSHYHYDHVRPGFTDFRYLFSSKEELQRMFEDKTVYAKDNRDRINPSQRRRGFFFERDLHGVAKDIVWADGTVHQFGETRVTFSEPLPHGSDPSPMGFVIAATVDYEGSRVLFAPDVQGPMAKVSLNYILKTEPNLLIIGGPPIYIGSISPDDLILAQESLTQIARRCETVVVDHHLSRSDSASDWLLPIREASEEAGNRLLSMAELAGREPQYLEAQRRVLYEREPPNDEFMRWARASEEEKNAQKPPLESQKP